MSVVIDVDKANNVTVQTNSGYGQTLTLADGMNRLDLSQDDNPLLVTANPGATIESIAKEGSPITPSGDGAYRLSFTAPTMFQIVTSGEGTAPGVVAKDITMDFFASGEGVTGKPFKVFYEKDGEWLTPGVGMMNYSVIPENAKVKIVPDKVYEITGCSVPGSDVVLDGTVDADGAYVFTNNVPDYYRVQVNMKVKEGAIKFTIAVDYSANVSCVLENQRQGAYEYLTVYDNMTNSYVIDKSQNPLEFIAAPGAQILQVLKNGEVQNPIGWGGTGGYVFEVKDGDNFVVSTQGAPTDILIEAPEGNAPLESYFFRRNDGSVIALSGASATLSGNLGETIKVSPRPGTQLSYIIGNNGGNTNMLDQFRVMAGADGENPVKYMVYGKRDVTGVVIDVDKAERVTILQEGGRGDALTLANGKNQFALADIKNALAISASEGNQMVSVTVNGDAVTVSPNGAYMVEAKEGDYITVTSRKSPVDATLKFNFNEGADISWLTATSEGEPVALSNHMTVKSYTTLVFKAADGYVLEEMTCATAGTMLLPIVTDGTYQFTVSTADVTEAELNVTMKEMEAAPGNSIVIPNGDALMLTVWEMTSKEGSLSDNFVKKLNVNHVNEVKTGNWLRLYCNDTQSEFVSVKVNGQEIEYERAEGALTRTVWLQVEGRSVVDAVTATPCQAYTAQTFDDIKHVVSGNVYIEVDGKQYTSIYAKVGQTVKLVAAPERGYVFHHFEKFYSETMAANGIALEGDTYTFTQEDIDQNFVLFKGVFNVDENQKTYAVRGSTAWLLDENGMLPEESSSAMGRVMILLNDGTYVPETTAIEGETVSLQIAVNDPSLLAEYEVAGFCLMAGFPNSVIPSNYVVKAEDADTEGVIWINGLIKKKVDSVDNVAVADGISYNAADQTVTAPAAVKIFSISGQLMISSEEGTVSVASLAKGIYVAVSGNSTLKFAK